MVRSGPKSLMMLKLILFNYSSPKKYPPDLSFVQIPGKLTPVLLHVDTSIVSSIIVNDSTQMVKEITSTDWKDSGVILNVNLHPKEESAELNYLSILESTSGDTIIDRIQKG